VPRRRAARRRAGGRIDGTASGTVHLLRVRIDGRDGWIRTSEDFLAIGRPQAG
jgi:hypothetical protein